MHRLHPTISIHKPNFTFSILFKKCLLLITFPSIVRPDIASSSVSFLFQFTLFFSFSNPTRAGLLHYQKTFCKRCKSCTNIAYFELQFFCDLQTLLVASWVCIGVTVSRKFWACSLTQIIATNVFINHRKVIILPNNSSAFVMLFLFA